MARAAGRPGGDRRNQPEDAEQHGEKRDATDPRGPRSRRAFHTIPTVGPPGRFRRTHLGGARDRPPRGPRTALFSHTIRDMSARVRAAGARRGIPGREPRRVACRLDRGAAQVRRWRRRRRPAEDALDRDLRRHLIKPLYTQDAMSPTSACLGGRRSSVARATAGTAAGWDVRQRHGDPDPGARQRRGAGRSAERRDVAVARAGRVRLGGHRPASCARRRVSRPRPRSPSTPARRPRRPRRLLLKAAAERGVEPARAAPGRSAQTRSACAHALGADAGPDDCWRG